MSGTGRELRCYACARMLGTYTLILDQAVTGAPLRLAEGLENREKRHANGLPWYGPAGPAKMGGRQHVRLPAVIECWCGTENRVQRDGPWRIARE